jgi:hypothetical protein
MAVLKYFIANPIQVSPSWLLRARHNGSRTAIPVKINVNLHSISAEGVEEE